MRAKGWPQAARRRHVTGEMNKLEQSYAQTLDLYKLGGSVADWRYESMKLRLAKRTWLTMDFLVILADGTVELHEVKGHWEDDARVKIKVAAEMFPWFTFRAYKKTKFGWVEEVIRE